MECRLEEEEGRMMMQQLQLQQGLQPLAAAASAKMLQLRLQLQRKPAADAAGAAAGGLPTEASRRPL